MVKSISQDGRILLNFDAENPNGESPEIMKGRAMAEFINTANRDIKRALKTVSRHVKCLRKQGTARLSSLVKAYQRNNAARSTRSQNHGTFQKTGTDSGGEPSDPDLPSHSNPSRNFNLQIFAHRTAQSQRTTILRYLSEGNAATQKELWAMFGICQAGARVSECRRLGWQIRSLRIDPDNSQIVTYSINHECPFIAPSERDKTPRKFDLQKFAELTPSDRERLTSQNLTILNFLQAGGIGTQTEIRDRFGVLQVGARIAELRKEGWNIETHMKPSGSNGVLIAHYLLDLANPRRKPTQFLPPDPDGIPDELKALPNWVCWTGVRRGEKWTKKPITIKGAGTSVTNPNDWATFDRAFEAYRERRFDGVGFVFTQSAGIVGIDLDHAIQDDGTLENWAAVIVEAFGCYTELSVSGRGLHIFTRANLDKGTRKGNVEIYPSGRYFCMTGLLWNDDLTQIHERQNVLNNLIAQLKPKNILRKNPVPFRQPASVGEIVDCGLRNPKFARLWNGDLSDVEGDDSRADFVLLLYLLKLSGGNEGIATSLFQQSALADRAKAERADYIPRTLTAARRFITGGAF